MVAILCELVYDCFLQLCFVDLFVQVDMSRENTDLCSNPFVALFGSITQVELYKTSVEDATKSGTCY